MPGAQNRGVPAILYYPKDNLRLEEWFRELPKMKYSKEQIQRLTKPVSTTTPKQIGHIEELVRSPSAVAENTPITITRYCNNCGQETQFKRDALGYMTCTTCREQAPDRSGRAD